MVPVLLEENPHRSRSPQAWLVVGPPKIRGLLIITSLQHGIGEETINLANEILRKVSRIKESQTTQRYHSRCSRKQEGQLCLFLGAQGLFQALHSWWCLGGSMGWRQPLCAIPFSLTPCTFSLTPLYFLKPSPQEEQLAGIACLSFALILDSAPGKGLKLSQF